MKFVIDRINESNYYLFDDMVFWRENGFEREPLQIPIAKQIKKGWSSLLHGGIKLKTLYLIGGTMGVGKTTVCQQLKAELLQSVFLDGDWCWDASPFQITRETKKMVVDNICYLLNNFLHCSAYENIVFCWVMQEQSIIDSIINQLDVQQCVIKCISLTADESELHVRLSKDVLNGLRNEDVIERSIPRIPLYQKLNTVKIDTSRKTIQMIVDEIKRM